MSTVMDNSGKSRNVGTNFWLVLLGLSLLVFAANTGYSIYKARLLGGASAAASNLQVNSQRLANQGREAVAGNADSFVAFKSTRQQINSDIGALNTNYGQAPGVSSPINKVTETWLPLDKSAAQLIESERAVLGFAGNANSFVTRVPGLQAQMDEVVRAMLAGGSPSSQVYLAVREGILAATMARRIAEIQAGGTAAQMAGDALARDAGVFGQVLQGFREGGSGEAQKVTAPAAVAALNAAIRDRRHAAGVPLGEQPSEQSGERAGEPVTRRGERLGLGDRVATRRNDRDLAVANRDTWTVAGIGTDGSLLVTGRPGQRALPADYVREHVELAFTTTAYGAQGETVGTAHLALGETTGAASAYVAMTRGRHHSIAHLVADTVDDARAQWVEVFSRDRADLGPRHAAQRAADDIDRYGPKARPRSVGLQAAALREGPRRPPPQPVPGPQPTSRGIGR